MVHLSRQALLAGNFLASALLFTTVSALGAPSFVGQVTSPTIVGQCDTSVFNAPDTVTVGQKFSVNVRFTNKGTTSWNSTNGRIFEWGNAATNNALIFGAPFLPILQQTVTPGQTATPKSEYKLTAPNKPGEYPLQIGILDNRYQGTDSNGFCKKKIKVVAKGQTSLPVEPAPVMACEGFEGLPNPTLKPGQPMNNIVVKMRNKGIYTWDTPEYFAFESWQLDPSDPTGQNWVQLFQTQSAFFQTGMVPPGGLGRAYVNSIAPTKSGTYKYEFQAAQGTMAASSVRCSRTFIVLPQCNDKIDNDSDGRVDKDDLGCTSNGDVDEANPTVDIKVNGQDGPLQVQLGSTVTVSWVAKDALRCNTGASAAPWGPNITKVPVGSQQVVMNAGMIFGIQCSELANSNIVAMDNVAVATVTGVTECSDAIDNDGDGKIDRDDAGCSDLSDNKEGDGPTDFSLTMQNVPGAPRDSAYGVRLTLVNKGPDTASVPVRVSATVPEGTSFEPLNSSGNCVLDGDRVRCPVDHMAVGVPLVLDLTFHINADAQCQSKIDHLAQVDIIPQGDPNSSNNLAAGFTIVGCPVREEADLKVLKTGPQFVNRGENVSYSVVVRNFGPSTAQNVIVREMIPPGFTFVASSEPTCTHTPTDVSCPIGALASGAQFALGFVYRTDLAACATVPSTAGAVSDTLDPQPINNMGTVSTEVRCTNVSSTSSSSSSSSSSSANTSSSSSSSSSANLIIDEQRCGVPSCTLAAVSAVADPLCRMNCRIPVWTGTSCATVTAPMNCPRGALKTMTLGIDGPAEQTYSPSDNNAVLANVTFATDVPQTLVKKMYVAIQGQQADGSGMQDGNVLSAITRMIRKAVASLTGQVTPPQTSAITNMIENVQIRNKVTGLTIQAQALTATNDSGVGTSPTSSYQIYRFSDVPVKSGEAWEVRVDFIQNSTPLNAHPRNGDKFRAIVCGEPTTKSGIVNMNGCTFGGLGSLSATNTAYNMQVVDLVTNQELDDVLPGGNLMGNFHKIATAGFSVTLLGSVSSDVAVKNSKNLSLLKFEARAENKDVLLTKAVFRSINGSPLNAQNYSLFVDTNGDNVTDTKVEGGVGVQGDRITFDDLTGGGFVISRDTAVLFEVRGDISASLADGNLQLGFASDDAGFLEAEEVSNGSSISDITLTTASAVTTNYTLKSQGNLYVVKSTEPLRSRQFLAGTLGETALLISLRAEHEDIDVTTLQITAEGPTASSIDRLELYTSTSVTPFATATSSGCGSDTVPPLTFCANMQSRQLVIQKGNRETVLVRPRLKSDSMGAVIGEKIALFIHERAVSNNTTGEGAVRARGGQSSNDLLANNGDNQDDGEVFIGTDFRFPNSRITGPTFEVVFAKLASLTNAGDATGVLTTTLGPIAKFRFTAAQNSNFLNGMNKWVLSDVIFSVVASNAALKQDSFKVYNAADTSTKVACSPSDANGSPTGPVVTGSFLVQCRNLLATIASAIDSGSSMTLVLEAEVTDDDITNTGGVSTLQVSLRNFTDRTKTAFSPTESHMLWLDQDTSSTSFTWVDFTETQVDSTTYSRS